MSHEDSLSTPFCLNAGVPPQVVCGATGLREHLREVLDWHAAHRPPVRGLSVVFYFANLVGEK